MYSELEELSKKKSTAAERRALRERSPEEWSRIIRALPKYAQIKVARIIWWDYFGNRMSNVRWAHLDDFMAQPVKEIPQESLALYLYECGYPPEKAIARSTKKIQ